jgi:hypothetical protein
VIVVGSALLQFLVVLHELGEPLNLNGDRIEDLKDESVVACLPDGEEALNAMFSAIPSTSTRSGVLVRQMLAFKRDHTIFEELRPPFFRRDRPSHFSPTEPIRVEVKGALKRKGQDLVDDQKPAKRAKPGSKKERKSGDSNTSKRKRDDEIDQGKPPKRAKISRKEGKSGGKNATQKPALKNRSRRRHGEK